MTAWNCSVLPWWLAAVLHFLKCEEVDVGVTADVLTSLLDQMKLWAKSYRKKGKERLWEKRMEDLQ